MLRSMTGFGSAVMSGPLGEFSVEVKSLNSRFLDLSVKTPKELSFAEMALRDEVKRLVRRGKVDLFVKWTPAPGAVEPARINGDLLARYADAVKAVLGPDAASGGALGALLDLPGVVTLGRGADESDGLRAAVLEAAREALEALDVSRASEGAPLARAVAGHIETLARLQEEVSADKQSLVAAMEERLRARIEEIARRVDAAPDPARLEMELALYADKSDVTEELVRLDAHLVAFRKQLDPKQPDPVGKTMDFLAQELLREVNTLGTKARGLAVAQKVVEMKAEVEKLREQVQNLE